MTLSLDWTVSRRLPCSSSLSGPGRHPGVNFPIVTFKKMTSKDELLFAKRLQEEQAQQLRNQMEASGVLSAARESAHKQFKEITESGVDIAPEIAGAMAWGRFSGSSKAGGDAKNKMGPSGGKMTDCGRFELTVSDKGIVKVVPVDHRALALEPGQGSGGKGGGGNLSKIQMLMSDPSWTANTSHDPAQRYQYWWWPGSWYKYATMLRKIDTHRFEILALFKKQQDEANQPPHPAAMMPPEQLAEKVMMLQRLQMRRQDLANELARMDAGIRRELRTLPPQDFIPPETLDPKSAYALRALQGQRQRLDAMLLGGEARQRALKAEGGRLATQALAIATVLVCTGAFAGWRYFSSQTGVETPEEFRTWAEGTLAKEGGVTQEATRRVAELAGTVSEYTPDIHETTAGQIVREVSVRYGGVGGRGVGIESNSDSKGSDTRKE